MQLVVLAQKARQLVELTIELPVLAGKFAFHPASAPTKITQSVSHAHRVALRTRYQIRENARMSKRERDDVIDTTGEAEGVELLEQPDQGDDENTRRRRFEMPLGVPFAFTGEEVELLEAESGIPGCFASVQCKCGECFKIDLLKDNLKPCPTCGTKFTHVLIVGVETDVQLAQDFVNEVLEANGHQAMGEVDDDADELEDDDEEEDDQDGDADERNGDDDADGE